MRNLNIKNFKLVTNLVTNLDQATYDLIGREENDYFDVTRPDNVTNQYVISFYKDCELVKMALASEDDLEKVITFYADSIWEDYEA